jgi:phosphohistidine phosphatase SixA
MGIWLVRHACAGHKDEWRGDDEIRPLDPAGWSQAEGLASLLAPLHPARLVSSPVLRCVQTLQPLADRTGLTVEEREELRVEAHTDVAALVAARVSDPAFDGSVACTHGEVMHPLLAGWRRTGLVVEGGDPGDERLLFKGSAWRLDQHDGALHLRLLAPFARAECPTHG